MSRTSFGDEQGDGGGSVTGGGSVSGNMSIGSGMERSMDGDDTARFMVGQKVDARYRGGRKYYSGVIRKVSV